MDHAMFEKRTGVGWSAGTLRAEVHEGVKLNLVLDDMFCSVDIANYRDILFDIYSDRSAENF